MTNKETLLIFGCVELILSDLEKSETLHHLEREVCKQDEYGIKDIILNDDDIVIDIGANVGLVSIFLAKKNPNVKIYSYEAHPYTYKNLVKNVELNSVTNVITNNLAVYSIDNEMLEISLDVKNTGSSSCFKKDSGFLVETVPTICLDSIITNNNIKKIKFLKVDCEGAEFDIFENSKLIHEIEIENIGIEIHSFMKSHGKDVELLKTLIKKISINNPKIKVYGK